MSDLGGWEVQEGIGNSTNHVPIRFEGGIGVFDCNRAAGVKASNEAFIVSGQIDAGGHRAVAEGIEVEEEACHGKEAIALGAEGRDVESGCIPCTGSKSSATR
jgi:hypothetical protein